MELRLLRPGGGDLPEKSVTMRQRIQRPSTGAVLWIAFFVALMFSPARIKLVSADGDPCWHRRHGEWMLQHRAVLRSDEFTHTRTGAPLVDTWWLSEVLTALAGRALGWTGVAALSAAVIATTLRLLHRQLLADGVDELVAIGFVLLAAAPCATHWLARPHLATQLMVLVFACQLRGFRCGRVSTREMYFRLPALMMLWANLHGGFIAGFVLIAIYLATCPGQRKTLTLLFAASLLASLINPNGWRLHEHIFRILHNPFLVRYAQEYEQPSLLSAKSFAFALYLIVGAATLLAARRRLVATDAVLLVVWLWFALEAVRNVPLFALVTTPILADHANGLLRSRCRSSQESSAWQDLAYMAIAVSAVLIARPATDIPRERYPVAAVEWLQSHSDAVGGVMFSELVWGGYLTWAAPERKIFVDAGADDESLLREYDVVDEVRSNWASVLQNYGVGWTLLPASHALNQSLAVAGEWSLVYADGVSRIYRRLR